MKLAQTDETALIALGMEASQMLADRKYSELASRFDYALAYGRDLATAIEADHSAALASPYEADQQQPITVKYFKPNSTGLFAAIECSVPASGNTTVLLSLIVAGTDAKQVTIEDINGIAT